MGAYGKTTRAAFSPPSLLSDLPDGAYLIAVSGLDEQSLCSLDRVCRSARCLNNCASGPWRTLGVERFKDLKFEEWVKFGFVPASPLRAGLPRRVDWKGRYWAFVRSFPTFLPPFEGREITCIDRADEIVFCDCIMSANSDVGMFLEVLVQSNPDNLSIALVNRNAAGFNSLTFSPDAGAIIRERRIQENPRQVQGAYVRPLSASCAIAGSFEGAIGIYFKAGHIAFFRKLMNKQTQQLCSWETTGYICDMSWADGPCVVPAIAFRDADSYHVRLVGIVEAPPLHLGKLPTSYDESQWTNLDWVGDTRA